METPSTQLTNCDWLSFSVLMTLTAEEARTEPLLTTPQGFSIVEASGTNMYKRRALVYSASGDKVLTLLWAPHSKIIADNSLFVEIANPLLYSGDYTRTLDLLRAIHPFTWQSLSRLDIATDFQPSVSQEQVIDMLNSGSIYVQGKRDGTMFHNFSAASKYVKRRPRQIAWGSPNSQIKWKLYNKTLEIFPPSADGRKWCSKPYIFKMWHDNGFDDTRDTWRLEVSIMGSGQLQWHGHRLTWETAANEEALTSLFYDLYATRMKMRLNQGHENKRYDKEIEFLKIPDGDFCRIKRADPADDRKHVAFAPTLRALVKELERPEVSANPAVHSPLLATLETVTRSAGLDGYFAAAVGERLDTWVENYKKNSGRLAAATDERT